MSDFCKHRCYIICFGFLEFGAVNQFYFRGRNMEEWEMDIKERINVVQNVN